MSLYDILNHIAQEKWRYYDEMIFNRYEEAIAEPLNFIASYFSSAGKNEFLYESLFNFHQTDNDEQNVRAIHTVNTFFLGLYLLEEIDYLKPNKNSFLGQAGKGDNFLWAWFLCSLYHDAFFDKNEDVTVSSDYNIFSKGLLYNPDLIQRYYEKCKTKETAYKNNPKFDHGIVAAEKLYSNYTNMIVAELEKEPNQFKNFIANKDLIHYGLKINYSTFCAMCKIAKIIACHSIFVADDETKASYKNVTELIPGNKKFFHMPNIKNRYALNSYEKLYFLLALVDTLEPSKRGITLDEINIYVDKIKYGVYDLHITFLSDKGDQEKYLIGLSKLSDWLNFVVESSEDKTIRIDFYKNKNYNRILS